MGGYCTVLVIQDVLCLTMELCSVFTLLKSCVAFDP